MHSASIEAKEINERLERIYGLHVGSSKANFRVVWSDDQFEKRMGTFSVWAGDIYLREETGVREVAKYRMFERQWVLERLHENYHQDVMDGSFVYEPLFTFSEDKPLNYQAIEMVIAHALKRIPIDFEKRLPLSEKEMLEKEEVRFAKEVKDTRNQLDEISNPSELQLALQDGDAVSLAVKQKVH